MISHYDLTWDGHVFVFSSSARFHTLIHGVRMVGVVICYVHNILINVITSLIRCKWMTSCHHVVKAIEHVQEYPTMHYFGIPRHTQPMIAYGIWLTISGNSCCKLHSGNMVCGGQQVVNTDLCGLMWIQERKEAQNALHNMSNDAIYNAKPHPTL